MHSHMELTRTKGNTLTSLQDEGQVNKGQMKPIRVGQTTTVEVPGHWERTNIIKIKQEIQPQNRNCDCMSKDDRNTAAKMKQSSILVLPSLLSTAMRMLYRTLKVRFWNWWQNRDFLMLENKVWTAGCLFISLILTLSCITTYIDEIHAGGERPVKREGQTKREEALEWLWMCEKVACQYWP